jgi:hypothetical protein
MNCGCKAGGEEHGHGPGGHFGGGSGHGFGGGCSCGCGGGCGCHGGMFGNLMSRAKKIRMLQEMKEDLQDQIEAINEEIAELKKLK